MQKITNDLLALAQNGDETAVAALIARMMPAIRKGAAAATAPGLDFEDAVQEGLIGLLKAVRSFDHESASFSTYASICIKRSIISALRKLNRTNRFELSADPASDFTAKDTSPSPEYGVVERENARERYDTFVNDLSPFERRTFFMYMKGASYNRMAKELSCSEKSIDNDMTRIKSKLKRRTKQ